MKALFARQMYHNLGNRWASATLAFLVLAMTPLPFIFYRCKSNSTLPSVLTETKDGAAIRKNSKVSKMVYA